MKDRKVVSEINTADYPVLYETAMECYDYVNSTDKGAYKAAASGGKKVFSLTDGYMDYVHVNSVCMDLYDGNIIVSMRHQYAVYKFNKKTGELMWTLSGLNDEFVLSRSQKFIGQNFAYMTNGSGERLVFDNHTSFAQNETRMAEFQFRNRNETGVMQTTF